MDEVTLGEVARRVDALHQDFRDLKASIAMHDEVERRFESVQKDIDDLEAWQTWAMRIVLGAVIVAVLSLALVRAA